MSATKPIIHLMMAILIASCATAPTPPDELRETEIVFPPPPDEARFVFERTLQSSADIQIENRGDRWRRVLTGESEPAAGFSKPFDVEACHGRVYVSDTVRRVVFVFDVPNGKFFEIGDREPGQLFKPLGMATDEDCNLYVVDQTANRIVIYDQDGNFLSAIGGAEMFDRLSHVEVTPDGSRIYAVDTGGIGSSRHHIRVFDGRSGTHLFDIGHRGDQPGELNLARDIAVGRDGKLYIVDSGNFRVQVFDSNGEFVSTFGSIGMKTGNFSMPKGIDTDSAGNIYVSDAAYGNFQIFSSSGELLLFVGERSDVPEPAKYLLPAGIAVDEDGRVYMVDQFFRKVDIFRPASLSANGGYLGARNRRP